MDVRAPVIVALAVSLSACAALSRGAPATTDRAIPWIDAKPTGLHQGLATPVADGLPRACTANQLLATYGGAMALTNGQLQGSIGFVNTSAAACALQGAPTVQLLGSGGAPVAASFWMDNRFTASPIVLQPLAEPLSKATPSASQAWLEIDWSIYDESGDGKCSVPLAELETISVRLPGGDSVSTPALCSRKDGWITFCPPRFGVSPFLAPQPPTSASLPTLPDRYWSYTVTAPPTAVAGSTIGFHVTLTNVYYRALEFRDGCPEYIEVLGGPGGWTTGKIFYVLNCAPIGLLAPGASLTFAMKIDIPPSAPPGSYILGWELDTGETSYGAAMANFDVTAE